MPEYSAAKPYGVGLPLSPEEVVELKMIVQDEDSEGALDFVRRLRKKVLELERHMRRPEPAAGP